MEGTVRAVGGYDNGIFVVWVISRDGYRSTSYDFTRAGTEDKTGGVDAITLGVVAVEVGETTVFTINDAVAVDVELRL